MKIEFNRVTWYSKLAALVLFLVVVPVLCFYIGEQYGSLKAEYPGSVQSGILASGNAK